MEPLRISRFENAARVFQLKEPLVVDVEFDEGVWTYHNSLINLWGSGAPTRRRLHFSI